jgi:hypothetical protein
MTKEKQIEDMAKVVGYTYTVAKGVGAVYPSPKMVAMDLYDAGYRKQSEGEWELHKDGSGTCSECHFTQKNVWDYDNWQNFCGHCGVRMKGARMRGKENEHA